MSFRNNQVKCKRAKGACGCGTPTSGYMAG